MTIHHAIVKSAATKGVILTQDDDTADITGLHAATNARATLAVADDEANSTAKDALHTVLEMVGFNSDETRKGAKLVQTDDGMFEVVLASGDAFNDAEGNGEFESLEDAIYAYDNRAEEADEEEEGATGSIVPHIHKARYKAAGHPTNCGDWLTDKLNEVCIKTDADGKDYTDHDILDMIAAVNNTPTEKYPHGGNRGWQGRRRMTIRNVMAKRVAAAGFLLIPENVTGKADKEHKAPAAFIAKHHKPKAPKQTK